MEQSKYLYIDTEVISDPKICGWKNFKNMGFSCGVLGWEEDREYKDESYTVLKDYFKRIVEFIKLGYTVVSFNGVGFDNNLIAYNLGVIDINDYLNTDIGGSRSGQTWTTIDSGYLTWVIEHNAGQYEVAKAILDYRNGVSTAGKKTTREYKEYLDKHSLDILLEIDKATGENYSVGLNSICSLTINREKSGEATEVFNLYKEGRIQEIIDYCKNDTKILYEVHKFILEHHYVIIPLYKKYTKLTSNICLKVPL